MVKVKVGRFVVIVDDQDYPLVATLARRVRQCRRRKDGRRVRYADCFVSGKWVPMHRLIMNVAAGVLVDHKNGDGLDNRRDNLRKATCAQNSANQRAFWGRSKYKGVWTENNGKTWRAGIMIQGKRIHLGSFTSEEDAAEVYDRAATSLFGEFACLNFPSRLPEYTDNSSPAPTSRLRPRNPESPVSRHQGVSWHRRMRKWQVRVTVNGRRIHVGLFENEEDAARAYMEKSSRKPST